MGCSSQLIQHTPRINDQNHLLVLYGIANIFIYLFKCPGVREPVSVWRSARRSYTNANTQQEVFCSILGCLRLVLQQFFNQCSWFSGSWSWDPTQRLGKVYKIIVFSVVSIHMGGTSQDVKRLQKIRIFYTLYYIFFVQIKITTCIKHLEASHIMSFDS